MNIKIALYFSPSPCNKVQKSHPTLHQARRRWRSG